MGVLSARTCVAEISRRIKSAIARSSPVSAPGTWRMREEYIKFEIVARGELKGEWLPMTEEL